uniref:Alpha-type protein kinase domain-containing protein n=1 Tax=Panagrolaimus sp. ES5 TaxID=591445 RepID=A0AC34FSS3_9BILA
FDIKDVKNITDSVFTAVSTSLIFLTGTQDIINSEKTLSYTLTPGIPEWDKEPTKSGRYINYAVPENMDVILKDEPIVRNKPILASIQIASSPFAKGAERYAFYGCDVTNSENPRNIILKEYIHCVGITPSSRFESANQIQTIASFFAKNYNEVFTKQNGFFYKIEFLKVQTLFIDKENRYLSCEKQLKEGDEFVKFTNNADYVILQSTAEKKQIGSSFISALTAFSHWTYQVTRAYLMVVDLQGIMIKENDKYTALLTDPAIHCCDKTRFGKMNLGKAGMEHFFNRHECNEFCKSLRLSRVFSSS